MITKFASLGSVSSGTMRNEDLLPEFAYELDYQIKRQGDGFDASGMQKLIEKANTVGDYEGDDADYIMEELFDALNEFAPAYAYFGTSEGDGACYGYFVSPDIEYDFDGLKVDDTSEMPDDYEGEVLEVNDHGNMTLYVARPGQELKEIWGVC